MTIRVIRVIVTGHDVRGGDAGRERDDGATDDSMTRGVRRKLSKHDRDV